MVKLDYLHGIHPLPSHRGGEYLEVTWLKVVPVMVERHRDHEGHAVENDNHLYVSMHKTHKEQRPVFLDKQPAECYLAPFHTCWAQQSTSAPVQE